MQVTPHAAPEWLIAVASFSEHILGYDPVSRQPVSTMWC